MERFANRKACGDRRPRRWRRALSAVLIALLLTACAPLARDAERTGEAGAASPMAAVMAAELAVARNDAGRAVTLYDGVGERLRDADVLERGARLALQAGALPAASRLAGHWVREAPDSLAARRVQGLIRLQRGDIEGAVVRLGESLPEAPGARDAAISQLAQRLRDGAFPTESLGVMQAVLDSVPDSEAARLALAQLAISRDRPRLALESVAAVPADAEPSIAARLLRADALLLLDRADEAFAIFRRLLATSPENDGLRFEYGRALLDAGREDQAVPVFQALVESGSQRPRVLNTAVVLGLRSGDDRLALTALRRLRRADRALTARSLLLEGRLLRRLDRPEESRAVFNRGVRAHPDHVALRYARAMARIEAGDRVGGEADLRAIIADDPAHAEALNALGYTLVDQTERIDAGAELIERAYQLRPDAPAIIDSMGWAAYRQGRNEAALEFLRRAHELTDGDAEIAAHLGEVLWTLGRRDAARAVWRAAVLEGTDQPVLEATMERLDP
jgi:tetratricopeptide (TPR) repeat protein